MQFKPVLPEIALIGGLGALALVRGGVRPKELARSAMVFIALVVLAVAYDELRSFRIHGTRNEYMVGAMQFALIYGAVGAYAGLFFHPRHFYEVFWRATRWAMVLATSCYVLTIITGRFILVNPGQQGLRLEGLLSEPSAWAPFLGAAVILAVRERSVPFLVLALVDTLLTKSPVVYMTVVLGVIVYWLVTAGWKPKHFPFVLLLAWASFATVQFVQNTDPVPYLTSTSSSRLVVGRFIAGIQDIDAGRTSSAINLRSNLRYASTQRTLAELRNEGWMNLGYGPGSAPIYFNHRFGPRGVRPNSFIVEQWFNFGRWGALLLSAAMAWALVRMRRQAALAAIFVPAFIACVINSAQGSPLYKYAVLGVLLFAAGWARSSRALTPSEPRVH